MADLINRDHAAQAIEAYLCSQCDYDTDRDPICIACPHLDGDEILKSVPTVNHWISVEDALPEQDGFYLAYFTFKDGTHATDIAYINTGCNLGSITHWMPLPNKPEVNSDAKSNFEKS